MIKDKCNEDDAGIFIEHFMDVLIWLSVVSAYCWYRALLFISTIIDYSAEEILMIFLGPYLFFTLFYISMTIIILILGKDEFGDEFEGLIFGRLISEGDDSE